MYATSTQGLKKSSALLLVVLCVANRPLAQNSEVLYAIPNPPAHVFVIDPSSGSTTLAIPSNWSITGLASDGTRLFSVTKHLPGGPFLGQSHLVGLENVTCSASLIGPTGYAEWPGSYFDYNPQDGFIYALINNVFAHNTTDLFKIDPTTGAATWVGPLTGGFGTPAIDSAGNAYLVGNQMFTLDLTTGSATFLGNLTIGQFGYFDGTAFDSTGRLWGSFRSDAAHTGLYTIDVGTLTATKVVSLQKAYVGLAFGPACVVERYCTAKQNSLGCLPQIAGGGVPSASARCCFVVSASNVRNNRVGILLYGTSGRAAVPFHGGTLCVSPPIRRAPQVSSAGTPAPAQDCSGRWELDFNAFLAGTLENDPAAVAAPFPAGTRLNCQWWGRDTPGNAALTDALEFELCP